MASALVFADSQPQQPTRQGSVPSDKTADYFPEDAIQGMGGLLARFLASAEEPRLFGVVQQANVVCYRFDWMAGRSGRLLAVRLSFDPDGSARIIRALGNLRSSEVRKTEFGVSAGQAQKFLQLLAMADFWSMPALEPENPDRNRKVYVLGADTWIFEGVRSGTYHVVMRRAPVPSPFTEMVSFLTKDLAKLDDSWTPKASPPPPPIKTNTIKINNR